VEYVPLCEPWPLPASGCADLSTASPAVTGFAVTAASEVLWALSGHQFGDCEVLVRPCRPSCPPSLPPGTWWNTGAGWWPQIPAPGSWLWWEAICGSCGTGGCGCNSADTLILPSAARAITQVLVDGVELVEGDNWTLYNGTLLVRTDGQRWPLCQDWTVPVSGEGAWSYKAIFGRPVPAMGSLALAELTSEIIRGCSGGPCRLPAFTKGVNRQGVAQEFKVSPIDIAEAGIKAVGLRLVDLFLMAENPGNLDVPPRIYNPDDYVSGPPNRRPGGAW
jgi:hypothetical protein